MIKKIYSLGCLFSLFYSFTSYAVVQIDPKFAHQTYLGFMGGYGSTTWQALVPPLNKQGDGIALSTPSKVSEGGAVWGFFAGYEFLPTFALEGSYVRYPNAKLSFNPLLSLYAYLHNHMTEVSTHTEVVSFLAKVMLIIPNTTVRVYSSVGGSEIHRYDQIVKRWHFGPTFGFGVNYNITEHIMSELGFSYTTGYGQSELSPANDFIPFLYSATLNLAYRL